MRTLVILEVSQKQAYIFKNKRLQNNMNASAQIRYVTSTEYFCKIASDLFQKENMVYDGGGHTILEFASEEAARAFVARVTSETMKKPEFQGIEIFAKIRVYHPEEKPAENEKNLIAELEKKKSIRAASFHQGTFGIEQMNVKAAERIKNVGSDVIETAKKEEEALICKKDGLGVDTSHFELAEEFEALGGSKNEKNFIAVVHIDGNLMGKRVAALADAVKAEYPHLDEASEEGWKEYRKAKDAFSKAIDHDFKIAYREMLTDVQNAYAEGKLDDLDLKLVEDPHSGLKKVTFPVRRIITAGDDICFVAEGRIGISCAVSYLKHIWKKVNTVDHKNYSACAGVAIVHQKYPFYRAYELAEALCSNAKKYIAALDTNASAHVCAIDWHIEFGEMQDGLAEIRKQYQTAEKNHLEMRPYLVCGEETLITKDPIRRFEHFEAFMNYLQKSEDTAARRNWKGLRGVLKGTEHSAGNYLTAHLLEDPVRKAVDCYEAGNEAQVKMMKELMSQSYQEHYMQLFYPVYQQRTEEVEEQSKHSLVFDAVEIIDQYLTL